MATEEEIKALVERCKIGNMKLNRAWRQIRELGFDTEDFKEQSEEWSQKTVILGDLGMQLKSWGFNDCLYMDKGVKTMPCLDQKDGLTCWACPSEFKYYEAELFGGPVPGQQIKLGG